MENELIRAKPATTNNNNDYSFVVVYLFCSRFAMEVGELTYVIKSAIKAVTPSSPHQEGLCGSDSPATAL